MSVVGEGLREQTPEFENKFPLEFSFLSYELLFINTRANSTIGIIIIVIIRLTLFGGVNQKDGQSLFSKEFPSVMAPECVAEGIRNSLCSIVFIKYTLT